MKVNTMPGRKAFHEAREQLLYAHERNTSLCAPFLAVVPVTGAAVSILGAAQSTVCASNPAAARLDELQFDLGEGPCWDALATRRPVIGATFDGADRAAWPLFVSSMVADELVADVKAIFAFPLYVGPLDIGAVDLFSTSPATLTDDQIADASQLANVAGWQVLRRMLADQEVTGSGVTDETSFSRREVHQATGMVLAQLGVTPEEALLLLRAHAFSAGRSVAEIANDVVERRLNFSDGTP